MTLPVLDIVPEKAAYQAVPGENTLSARLDGPRSKIRAAPKRAAEVNVAWLLDADGFDTLGLFYFEELMFGALPFQIDLILDEALPATYTAFFRPNSVRFTAVRGETYSVVAQLYVRWQS